MHLRRFFFFVVCLSAAVFAGENPAKDKNNVAVSDLTGQGVDQASAAIISDRLRTELFTTGAFKVLERQSMKDILKEQGFQQTGCTSDQCMVEIGQLLGVSHIISGTVGKLGEIFTLNVRMISVQTGEIVYTTSVDCRCAIEDVLTISVPSIAKKIAGRVRNPDSAAVQENPIVQPTATGTKAGKDSVASAQRSARGRKKRRQKAQEKQPCSENCFWGGGSLLWSGRNSSGQARTGKDQQRRNA